jgi:UDP-glucose 4-epimerase
MNTKRAVVTGGAGFIGGHLASALKRDGWEVQVVDIKTGTDIRKPEDLALAFKNAAYVFHLAALPRVQYSIEYPHESHDTNVTGTLNVLLAAREAGISRVVYSASSSAYGPATDMPLRESKSPHPISPYALQKYAGELYCRMFSEVYGLSTVSLRYFNVYGPGADPEGPYAQVIPKFIAMRLAGKPMTITGDGTQTRDLVHVRDVVRANLLAAQSDRVGKGETINIGTGQNASIKRIAELIGGPTEYIAPRFEPHDTLADISRAKELLGWEPQVALEEGIAELKTLNTLP